MDKKLKKMVIAALATIAFVIGIQFVGALLIGALAKILVLVTG